MDDYDRGGHAKYSLTVHMIFVTKYRKKLFFGETDDDIKQFLYDAANAIDIVCGNNTVSCSNATIGNIRFSGQMDILPVVLVRFPKRP